MNEIYTIDEVVIELEAILDHCIQKKSAIGFFAALYYKTTCNIRDSIRKGNFEDEERMEKLDILFANRFIDAWRRWDKNEVTTKSWEIAFRQTQKRRTLILQHLLLGINAHINLDLGIASALVMDMKSNPSFRRDFIRINEILNSMLSDVFKDIQRLSPLSSLMGLHAKNSKSMLINFTIGAARDGAWCFAQDLFPLRGKEYDECIDERDHEISRLGSNLSNPKGFLRITTLMIGVFEWKNPAKIINVLKGSNKSRLKEALA